MVNERYHLLAPSIQIPAESGSTLKDACLWVWLCFWIDALQHIRVPRNIVRFALENYQFTYLCGLAPEKIIIWELIIICTLCWMYTKQISWLILNLQEGIVCRGFSRWKNRGLTQKKKKKKKVGKHWFTVN